MISLNSSQTQHVKNQQFQKYCVFIKFITTHVLRLREALEERKTKLKMQQNNTLRITKKKYNSALNFLSHVW